MIAYKDIRRVHLEISTRCNSVCPDCPRNFRGVDVFPETYPLCDMSLQQAKKIFTVPFLKQLTNILINGNHGDFVTAADALEIVEYFKYSNPALQIHISTNASARPNIWEPLGRLKPTIEFRIDGLANTHALYRQGTDFNFIIKNATKFINAGGTAIWTMILFDHNQHQVEECRNLSKELKFERFELVDHGRNTFPVFDKNKKLSHIIGPYTGSTDFEQMVQWEYQIWRDNPGTIVKTLGTSEPDKKISCHAKKNSEIYIAANGEVSPCCWLGFYPTHSLRNASNIQIRPLVTNNNAIEHGIETAIQWFSKIEETWDKTVPNGKIYTCNNVCGENEFKFKTNAIT